MLTAPMEDAMFWLVSLPFRLLFGIVFGLLALPFAIVLLPFALLLWIPFLLLKVAFRLTAALLLIPLFAVFGVIGLLVGGVALLAVFIPLIPIALLLAFGWMLFRGARAATA